MNIFCQSFPFSANLDAKILILGSMPGIKSLQEQQYYAHPQNCFWSIMESIFKVPKQESYDVRLQKLRNNRVALWDVAYQCERPGSLDAKIKSQSVIVNDFATFFKTHSQIDHIFFNGKKAESLFLKKAAKQHKLDLSLFHLFTLPSTSPANASIPRSDKEKLWKPSILKAFS